MVPGEVHEHDAPAQEDAFDWTGGVLDMLLEFRMAILRAFQRSDIPRDQSTRREDLMDIFRASRGQEFLVGFRVDRLPARCKVGACHGNYAVEIRAAKSLEWSVTWIASMRKDSCFSSSRNESVTPYKRFICHIRCLPRDRIDHLCDIAARENDPIRGDAYTGFSESVKLEKDVPPAGSDIYANSTRRGLIRKQEHEVVPCRATRFRVFYPEEEITVDAVNIRIARVFGDKRNPDANYAVIKGNAPRRRRDSFVRGRRPVEIEWQQLGNFSQTKHAGHATIFFFEVQFAVFLRRVYCKKNFDGFFFHRFERQRKKSSRAILTMLLHQSFCVVGLGLLAFAMFLEFLILTAPAPEVMFRASDGSTVKYRPGRDISVIQRCNKFKSDDDCDISRMLAKEWLHDVTISFVHSRGKTAVMYAVGNGLPQELLVVSSLEEARACARVLNNILPQGCESLLQDPIYEDTDYEGVRIKPTDGTYEGDQP